MLFKFAALFILTIFMQADLYAQPMESQDSPVQTLQSKAYKEVKFTGKFENIHFGVSYDGDNTINVDGKMVIFESGGRQIAPDTTSWGTVEDLKIPEGVTENYQDLNGIKVKVFCRVIYAIGPDLEPVPVYTLYGDSLYYIKRVKFLGIF